jgi:hypothetical protein
MLAHSIVHNDGVLLADRTIQYDPRKSVLKYGIGDRIRLNDADFAALCDAFLADIEAKYT